MTISVKKVSTSSKLTIVYLSCSPLCGLFSIQQNAKGDLSYKVKKHQFPDASKLSPVINHALYYIIFRLSNA